MYANNGKIYIGFDKYMTNKWEDNNLLSQPILDFFHSADHVCANVEGALIDAVDDGSRGVFFHSMNPEATTVLKKIAILNICIIKAEGNEHCAPVTVRVTVPFAVTAVAVLNTAFVSFKIKLTFAVANLS